MARHTVEVGKHGGMILNEHQKTSDPAMVIICWRCDAPMKIKTITPAMTSAPLDDVRCNLPNMRLNPAMAIDARLVQSLDHGLDWCSNPPDDVPATRQPHLRTSLCLH
jgi:hypothetical protein